MIESSDDPPTSAGRIFRAAVRARFEIADFAGAERLSREFLDRVPEVEQALIRTWLGWSLLNQGRSREAAECFERALAQRADLADIVLGSFWAYLLHGEDEEAKARAARLVELAGHAGWGLARQVESARGRYAALDPVGERLFAELHRDYEVIVDIAGIEHRQDIRVLQLGRDLDFVQEFLVPGVRVFFRDFQRDTLFLDRIVGTVDVGKRAGRNPSEHPVFADFLSSFKQVWLRCRFLAAEVRSRSAIIGALSCAVKGNVTIEEYTPAR